MNKWSQCSLIRNESLPPLLNQRSLPISEFLIDQKYAKSGPQEKCQKDQHSQHCQWPIDNS